jgi:hypothetical protein
MRQVKISFLWSTLEMVCIRCRIFAGSGSCSARKSLPIHQRRSHQRFARVMTQRKGALPLGQWGKSGVRRASWASGYSDLPAMQPYSKHDSNKAQKIIGDQIQHECSTNASNFPSVPGQLGRLGNGDSLGRTQSDYSDALHSEGTGRLNVRESLIWVCPLLMVIGISFSAGHKFPRRHRHKNGYPDQIRPASSFLELFVIYH